LIAIKKLYSSEEKEFQKEVTILKALGSKQEKHPHLIKLLATYRQERKYHLMFPYADANLRTYWDDRPSPIFDEATVLWTLKQMAGIASALSSIHNYSVTYPLSVDGPGNVRVQKDAKLSVEKSEELYGRHGDIKPENILWFRQTPDIDDEKGILQIADFGLGRFHGRDSRSLVNPDSVLGSPTYEPPECKLHRPVSRAYDIWSLGCLYLEFITWLLKGFAEIEGFSEFRGRSGSRSKELNDDYFFTIIRVSNIETDAVVREEVVIWVNQLHEHEKCSALIHDLLDLVMKEVLLTDASKRIGARWLYHRLKACLNKAKEDKSYLLQPVPRRQKLSGDGLSNSTSTVLDPPQMTSKKVTFTRPDKLVPLTSAHSKPPKDLVQRGPATPGLTRSKTHSTWPPSGPSNG
jgi:serine/threonine protein kinase